MKSYTYVSLKYVVFVFLRYTRRLHLYVTILDKRQQWLYWWKCSLLYLCSIDFVFAPHQSKNYRVVITIIFHPHHYSYHLFDDTATNNLVKLYIFTNSIPAVYILFPILAAHLQDTPLFNEELYYTIYY